MTKLPTVKVTKSGKKYFVVNGRKIFIESNMTKREMMSIYKLLLKKVQPKRTTKNVNKSSATIKQYFNHNPYRTRQRNNNKKKDEKDNKSNQKSTIDPANRVTVTSSNHPKDSG
jgi:hypothetical protein